MECHKRSVKPEICHKKCYSCSAKLHTRKSWQCEWILIIPHLVPLIACTEAYATLYDEKCNNRIHYLPSPTSLQNVSVRSLFVQKDKKGKHENWGIPPHFFVANVHRARWTYVVHTVALKANTMYSIWMNRRRSHSSIISFIIHRIAELWLKSNIKLAGKIFILFSRGAHSSSIVCELMRAILGTTIANMNV